MITGEICNKIDKIWTDMWAGGITNPLTVIYDEEQTNKKLKAAYNKFVDKL